MTQDPTRAAVEEMRALAALIKRPPLDDVLLEQAVAIRAAEAIETVLAALPAPASREAMELCEMPEVAAMRFIEKLRADEGDTVTILCDDPEASTVDKRLPVECNGGWTNWVDVRFYGESVGQCLAKAVVSRDTGNLLGGGPMGVSSDDAGYAYQKAPVATNAILALTPAHQLDAETVVDAVIELLKYRVGEQPEQGWLRDNDASRTALTNLARALKDTPNEQR